MSITHPTPPVEAPARTPGAAVGTGGGRYRSMIVARIAPGAEPDVAQLFAASDATDLPHAIGVTERSLYSLGDCYVHLVEFDRPVEQAMGAGMKLPGFGSISDDLRPYISPYLPTWRSPADAQARRFYTWRPDA